MKLGILSPPLHGHLNPFLAVTKELQARGHHITFFSIPDVGEKIKREGFHFVPIGQAHYPEGSFQGFQREMSQLTSMAAMLYWNNTTVQMANHVAEELLLVIQAEEIDCLLVDQIDLLGISMAQFLGIPSVTICNTLATNWEEGVPPSFVGLEYNESAEAIAMNRLVFDKIKADFSPVLQTIAYWRDRWGLPPFEADSNVFPTSPFAQIAQQPNSFDFPRKELPPNFHYAAPFRAATEVETPFPWERLNGKPLIYASLGTLVNGNERLFREIAAACQEFEVQLVIALGAAGDPAHFRDLPGSPLIAGYVPQQALLKKAVLTVTHAGLNTVLDSLQQGVPMVAIPISFDQAGIASRVRYAGVGEVVSFRKANQVTLRKAVETVLTNPVYREKASTIKSQLNEIRGAAYAADIIEQVVYTRQPVWRKPVTAVSSH